MRFSPARSLRGQLLLAVGVLALTAPVAVALIARQGTRQEFRKFRELERVPAPPGAATLTRRIASVVNGTCCSEAALAEAGPLLGPRDAIVVIDRESGRTIAAAGPALDDLRDVKLTVEGDVIAFDATRASSPRGHTAETMSLRFRGGPAESIRLGDGRAAELRVLVLPGREGGDDVSAAAFLGSLDRRLILITTLVGVLALAATWLVTRRIAGPIGELSDATRDLARGNLSRRVTATGADEVAQLARSFNAMADGLERQEALRRNLVNDVAHELRTPLTALRCRLEAIIDGLSANPRDALIGANEEVQHLARLVDDLQELALAEAGELRLDIGPIDLRDVIVSAVRASGLEADPRVRLEIPGAVRARGDAVRVRQCVMNLLTNAGRHTPAGGTITVGVEPAADAVRVEVRNTGSDLAPDALAQVFDRFYRADPARQRATGGTGLGLAIVKHLVDAQGGRVWARRDNGLVFGFSLPFDSGVR